MINIEQQQELQARQSELQYVVGDPNYQQYVQTLLRRYRTAKQDRAGMEAVWHDINILTRGGEAKVFSKGVQSTGATGPHTPYISSVASEINIAAGKFSSKVMNKSTDWFGLEPFEYGAIRGKLKDNPFVNIWLKELVTAVRNVFDDPSSSFYTAAQDAHQEGFRLGPAIMYTYRQNNGKIGFESPPVEDVFVQHDGFGKPNYIFRRLMLTDEDAYGIWGEDVHPSVLMRMSSESTAYDQKLREYVQISHPNTNQQHILDFEFIVTVIDTENKYIVLESGARALPYTVARFMHRPGDVYGRSNIWELMGDIKLINQMMSTQEAAYKSVCNPVMLLDNTCPVDPTKIAPGNIVPGGMTQGRPNVASLPLMPGFELSTQFLQMKLADVRRGLNNDEIIAENSMTPEQVAYIRATQMERIEHVIIRWETEFIAPILRRVLKLLEFETNALPTFPYEQVGIDPDEFPFPIEQLRIRYTGPLGKIHQMQQADAAQRLFGFWQAAAQLDPSVRNILDIGKIVQMIADANSLDVINSPDVIRQRDEEEAAGAQAQAQAAQEQQEFENMIELKKVEAAAKSSKEPTVSNDDDSSVFDFGA